MGSNDFYPEERPAHRVAVDGFWIDEHPVTVAEFRRFVKATGYVTWAERAQILAITPTPIPPCSSLDRWCSTRPPDRSISVTSGTGGTGRPARNGVIPRDRIARCTGVSSTR